MIGKFMRAIFFFLKTNVILINIFSMTPYDKQEYPSDMRQLLWSDFLYTYALGVKKYIFKEDNDLESNKLKYFKIAHYLLVTILLLSFLYIFLPFFASKCMDFYQWSVVYYDNL